MPLSDTAVSRPTAAFTRAAEPTCRWSRLMRRYHRPLRAVARRLLRRHGLPSRNDDVQELLQELWCRVFERAPARFTEGRRGTLTYLVTTLRHLATDRLRAVCAAKRGGLWRRVSLRAAGLLPSLDDTPEQRLLSHEERRRLLARLRRLSGAATRRRDLLILERALLDGWSSREIARSLGGELAPSSVDSLVSRVRRRFAAEGIELPRRSPRKR